MNDVENLTGHCHTCQVITPPTNSWQQLHMTTLPTQNWEYLIRALKGPLESAEHVIAVIDYQSKYPVVALMQSITWENIMKHLQKIFYQILLPQNKIKSENGPHFKGGHLNNI